MPIEIRELVVRATVTDQRSSPRDNQQPQQAQRAERLLAQVAEMLRKRRER